MPLASLRPLRNRSFAALFFSGIVSNIGTWMQTVAVGALVADKTGSAGRTALVAVAAFLPIGLFSPIGGALADRVDRKKFLMISNLVEAGMATGLMVLSLSGNATPNRVTLLVLVEGCVASLRLPFYQALLPDLVPKEDLLAAASLGSASYNMGRVGGPVLAGAVIAATHSYSWAFGVNAISFFAVIFALMIIVVPANPPVTDHARIFARIREGAVAAKAEPGCWAAIQIISINSFLIAPFIALIPSRAHELSGGGKVATAGVTSALTTAQGVGAVIGALFIASIAERFGRRAALTLYLVTTPLMAIAYGLADTTVMAVLALVGLGASYIGILSGLNTVVQLRAPTEFRGRILSLYFVALGVIYPIGALVQGPVADRFGLRQTTIVTALLMLAALSMLGLLRPHTFRILGESPTAGPPPTAREPAAEMPAAVAGPGAGGPDQAPSLQPDGDPPVE